MRGQKRNGGSEMRASGPIVSVQEGRVVGGCENGCFGGVEKDSKFSTLAGWQIVGETTLGPGDEGLWTCHPYRTVAHGWGVGLWRIVVECGDAGVG